jgi:proline iminopeptidase
VYAKVRDTKLFFDVEGAGIVVGESSVRKRPTAILIHGGLGIDHTSRRIRYARLSKRVQVVHFDQRGHGRSARDDPSSWTLDEHVEDLEALRIYLGLGRIVSLGTSYGATVAMAHAARYSESVSHLMLIAPAGHSGYVSRARQIVAQRGTAEQISQCEDLFCGRLDTTEKMRRYFEVMGSLYSLPHNCILPGGTLEPSGWSPEALNRAHGPGGFLRSYDLRPELSRIQARTRICAGRYDFICAPEFSQEIHQLIPHSELRIFDGSAHTIAADEPEALMDVMFGVLVYAANSSCGQ